MYGDEQEVEESDEYVPGKSEKDVFDSQIEKIGLNCKKLKIIRLKIEDRSRIKYRVERGEPRKDDPYEYDKFCDEALAQKRVRKTEMPPEGVFPEMEVPESKIEDYDDECQNEEDEERQCPINAKNKHLITDIEVKTDIKSKYVVVKLEYILKECSYYGDFNSVFTFRDYNIWTYNIVKNENGTFSFINEQISVGTKKYVFE